MWLRRLFIRPADGQLAAMESRRRLFTANQRHFLRLRDQTCRTAWCDAPIRHFDHIRPAELGGATSVTNGQGYCAACNYAKQAAGWRGHPPDLGRDCIEITTPTGHRYATRPPDPPGLSSRARPPIRSALEESLAQLLRAA